MADINASTSRDCDVQVRSRCEPVLQKFNFHWPTSLDCAGLPSETSRPEDLCIEPPGEDDSFPDDDASQPDSLGDRDMILHSPGDAILTLAMTSCRARWDETITGPRAHEVCSDRKMSGVCKEVVWEVQLGASGFRGLE